jgi:hypothetical protein
MGPQGYGGRCATATGAAPCCNTQCTLSLGHCFPEVHLGLSMALQTASQYRNSMLGASLQRISCCRRPDNKDRTIAMTPGMPNIVAT